jgi:hypothetical protein
LEELNRDEKREKTMMRVLAYLKELKKIVNTKEMLADSELYAVASAVAF